MANVEKSLRATMLTRYVTEEKNSLLSNPITIILPQMPITFGKLHMLYVLQGSSQRVLEMEEGKLESFSCVDEGEGYLRAFWRWFAFSHPCSERLKLTENEEPIPSTIIDFR